MQLPLKYLAVLAVLFILQANPLFAQANPAPYASANSERAILPACGVEGAERLDVRGSYSRYILTDLPYNAEVDARTALFEVNMNRRASAGIILSQGGNLCWRGGEINGLWTTPAFISSGNSNSSSIRIRNFRTDSRVHINHLVIRKGFNGIAIEGAIGSLVLDTVEMQNLRNACITLDGFASAIVYNSIFNGCGILLSAANGYHDRRDVVLNDSLIRIDMHRNIETSFIDLSNSEIGISITLFNNIFLFETYKKDVLQYMHDTVLKNVVACANNIFIFPDLDPAFQAELDCGLITADAALWRHARDTWLDLYGTEASGFHAGRLAEDDIRTLDVSDGVGTARRSQALSSMQRRSLVAEAQNEAAEARDVVTDWRRSVQRAATAAERAVEAVGLLLGRWSDDTLWVDRTGWAE